MFKFSNRLQFSFSTLYQILNVQLIISRQLSNERQYQNIINYILIKKFQTKNIQPSVPQDASQAQIKQSYLQIVKMYHPDTNSQQSKNQEYFKQVTAAYTILSNESERLKYDQTLNYSNSKEGSFYQQNYEQTSEQKKAQIKAYIYLAAFFLVYWLNSKYKQKYGQEQRINFLPNKYIPHQVVENKKKQLSEQDCKELPLEIIKQLSKKGDYIMGQLCYDRLIFDEQKILHMRKNLDDDFQQVGVNYINSEVSQKSEKILVDQQQQHQIQNEAEQKESLFLQNLESKEQIEEIRENEEQKQTTQQFDEQISDDQTLQSQQEVNNNEFENNSEQFVVEQNDQEEQFQQQSQQESQQDN